MCNQKISTLLKATRRGFLKGCPNLTEKLIVKYLNPSPATAKRHMKCPRHGIESTHPKQSRMTVLETPTIQHTPPQPVARIDAPVLPLAHEIPFYPGQAYNAPTGPKLIGSNDNESIANIFCFGAFVDKNSGIVYHNLMGSFPFKLYNGSICFFILYHYKLSSILVTPISGLDNICIFNAYKKEFEMLMSKGFKPQLNIMDNQATKHIKACLTKNDCKLQLVEPHNHRINAAEHAIQTFKDTFIAALATTDSKFPLQLWDQLTPQIQDTINLMQASCIDPTKSAYEILNEPYNWNRYPLALLGCKAIVYKDGDSRGSWASRGVNAWYLGPSKDHY